MKTVTKPGRKRPKTFWDLFQGPVSGVLRRMSQEVQLDVVAPLKHQQSEESRKDILNTTHTLLRSMIRSTPHNHYLVVAMKGSKNHQLQVSRIEEVSLILHQELSLPNANWFVFQQIDENNCIFAVNTKCWENSGLKLSAKANAIMAELDKIRSVQFLLPREFKTMRP